MSSWVFCISLAGAGDARLLPVLLLPSALAASARSCSAAPSSQPKCQLFQGMFYLFISFLFFFLFFFLIIIISERGNDLSCMGEESVVPALPPCLGLGGMKPPSLGETGWGRARTRAGHSVAEARRCSQGQEFTGEKPGNGTSTQQEPGAVSVGSPEIMENWVFEPLPTRHGSSTQLLPLKGKLPFLGGQKVRF